MSGSRHMKDYVLRSLFPQPPARKIEPVAWRVEFCGDAVRSPSWLLTSEAHTAELYRASGHIVEPLYPGDLASRSQECAACRGVGDQRVVAGEDTDAACATCRGTGLVPAPRAEEGDRAD